MTDRAHAGWDVPPRSADPPDGVSDEEAEEVLDCCVGIIVDLAAHRLTGIADRLGVGRADAVRSFIKQCGTDL